MFRQWRRRFRENADDTLAILKAQRDSDVFHQNLGVARGVFLDGAAERKTRQLRRRA